jgi:hypothetical protein
VVPMSKYPWTEDKVYACKTACILDFCCGGGGKEVRSSALLPDEESPYIHLIRGYIVARTGLDVVV